MGRWYPAKMDSLEEYVPSRLEGEMVGLAMEAGEKVGVVVSAAIAKCGDGDFDDRYGLFSLYVELENMLNYLEGVLGDSGWRALEVELCDDSE